MEKGGRSEEELTSPSSAFGTFSPRGGEKALAAHPAREPSPRVSGEKVAEGRMRGREAPDSVLNSSFFILRSSFIFPTSKNGRRFRRPFTLQNVAVTSSLRAR